MSFDIIKQSRGAPHCTVIIVNWNSWDILSCCLAKLQQQTFQNFNVLVVDNASDVPAPSDLIARFPKLTLIQNQTNLGFAAANNQAIKLLGDTEWVVLLNPDAFAEPDWLEQLIDAATTGGQHSDFSVYHGHRNLVWMFVKDMPGLLFWLLPPLHVALNLVSIVWFALRGQGGVMLRAKRDALLGLPKMRRKRREIQKNRVVSVGQIWRV